jgi:hypothetical protein
MKLETLKRKRQVKKMFDQFHRSQDVVVKVISCALAVFFLAGPAQASNGEGCGQSRSSIERTENPNLGSSVQEDNEATIIALDNSITNSNESKSRRVSSESLPLGVVSRLPRN